MWQALGDRLGRHIYTSNYALYISHNRVKIDQTYNYNNNNNKNIYINKKLINFIYIFSASSLVSVLTVIDYSPKIKCSLHMFEYLIGYLMALLMILIIEFIALIVSCRGSVLDTKPRKFLQHIIYSRLVLLLVEIGFIICGIYFLKKFQNICLVEWYDKLMRQTILGR